MISNDFKFSTWRKLKVKGQEGMWQALGVSDKSTHLAWGVVRKCLIYMQPRDPA